MFKDEIRIVAWDDCAFGKDDRRVTLVGPIFRGGKYMDSFLSTIIEKDGNDATEKIAETIVKSRNYDQLSIIMLNGITFGGFNVVNIKELHEKIKLPVIVIQRKMPDMDKFMKALDIFPDSAEKKQNALSVGEFFFYAKTGIYYQKTGLSEKEVEEILDITCIRSDVPESLRAAHIIASGLSGENRGRV